MIDWHDGEPEELCHDETNHVCVCVSGLTAAAMAELQKLQKMKMMMSLQNGNESDNEDLHSNTGKTNTHTNKHTLTLASKVIGYISSLVSQLFLESSCEYRC